MDLDTGQGGPPGFCMVLAAPLDGFDENQTLSFWVMIKGVSGGTLRVNNAGSSKGSTWTYRVTQQGHRCTRTCVPQNSRDEALTPRTSESGWIWRWVFKDVIRVE